MKFLHRKAIPLFYNLLFFFVPLVLFPSTSEIFEFNKMVLTYLLTILVVTAWIIKMILERKVIFRRTILDIPLLLFLSTQILSTVTSIDIRTSIFGYYSRYHGGLLSSISYSLLYWAFVSNMRTKETLKSIKVLFVSAILVSIYGVLEHFGIDKDIWVQDVQHRVFSTLGQPNWLAAWIVALIPVTWAFGLNSKLKIQSLKLQLKNQNFWLWIVLSGLFFLTLLYTRSRSGLLGFAVANLVFWLGIAFLTIYQKIKIAQIFKKFLILNFTFLILALASGTPWTPSAKDLLLKTTQPIDQQIDKSAPPAPALEVGGTASSEIRKIVWTGAVNIWKNYPIFGTGVETFAFSYYNFRPVEHNLVSEWDFLYNKAHNEYLNFASTTGTVGLLSYGFLIISVIYSFIRKIDVTNHTNDSRKTRKKDISEDSQTIRNFRDINGCIPIALLAGYVSILVTNFFGFSVVPVALLFFLYPAIAITLGRENGSAEKWKNQEQLSPPQTIGIIISCSLALWLFYSVAKYWYADYLYARGKLNNDAKNFVEARELLTKAVELSPKESIFWEELSDSSTKIALASYGQENQLLAERFATTAISESAKSVTLSPANVNLKRTRAKMFIELSALNPNYLINARDTLLKAVEQAPTDAKLYYNLALAYVRTGESEKAIEILTKTIDMKTNYRNARFALALLYIDQNEIEIARQQLEYILKFIAPEDQMVKQELEALSI